MSPTEARIITHAPHICLGLLILALIRSLYIYYFLKKSLKTTGKVVEIDSTNEGDTPIVEFTTQDQQTIRFRVAVVLGKERWDLGSVWPVRYLASAPQRAQIDSFHYRWMFVGILMAGAVLLFTASTVVRLFLLS